METKSLVSVVITSFRGTGNLKRALDSAYNQTYSQIEIIVVDDNNPETEERKATKNLMESYISENSRRSIEYICHPKNLNGAVARNTGVKHAKGKYIQLLDDDDVLFPAKIEKSVAIIERDHTDGVLFSVASCAGTKINVISGARESIGLKEKRAEMMLVPGLIGTGSNIFVTKKSYDELNGFDPSFIRMQDLEFMMRFFRDYKCSFCDEVLIIKSVNERKISWTDYNKQCEFKFKFWEKYKEDFDTAFTKEQFNYYFNLEYTHLFRIALMNKNVGDIKDAANRLKTIRPLTRSEKLCIRFHFAYLFLHNNTTILRLIRKYKTRGKIRDHEVIISDSKRSFINKTMM